MKSMFFARRALVILCIVFFLAPFALRGARMSLLRLQNNVKDWLPSDFPETEDLEWFGRHFMGEQFLIVTWPGASEDDPRFHELTEKLRYEVAQPPPGTTEQLDPSEERLLRQKPFEELTDVERGQLERWRAREIGDQLGLALLGDEYLDWGDRNEKWLRGFDDVWYFLTPDGELYRWLGRSNMMGWIKRSVQRHVLGDRSIEGELVTVVGRPATFAEPNEFYEDPRKVSARLFGSITSGPELLEQLASKDGPLWPRGVDEAFAAEEARAEALERLRGTLFGPDGRQTALLLTLSEAGQRDLKRAIGRPVLGRPRGRLLELATGQVGIPAEDLKLGGPPVDNVAIDEEGTITLARLVGFSALVGLVLAMVCFRSVKITLMIFFVGGVSAIASLGLVWWTGGTLDAIVMSMPSLVYVLGLSGAVHIINYYRDAVEEQGLSGAAGRALSHGWKPCSLAALTTSLGLMSLHTSNILPIRNFGLYSALGVLATLTILFTFLPSALEIWTPRLRIRRQSDGRVLRGGFQQKLRSFWESIGRFVVARYGWVTCGALLIFVIGMLGLPKLNTSVHLIKMFDANSKIIRDYAWLEENLGKLVPMEVVLRVQPALMRPVVQSAEELPESSPRMVPAAMPDSAPPVTAAAGRVAAPEPVDSRFQLNFLERMELTARVQEVLETTFGREGQGIVGRGMSAPTFAPPLPPPGFSGPTLRNPVRSVTNRHLEEHRAEYLESDYLRLDREAPYTDSELWRISLRLGSLMDIDYGLFVAELKRAVEPVLLAYELRTEILQAVDQQRDGRGMVRARVAYLGFPQDEATSEGGEEPPEQAIPQTRIFAETLRDLLLTAGAQNVVNPRPTEPDPDFYRSERWKKALAVFDCVVLVQDHPEYDLDFLREHAGLVIDARDHRFDPDDPSAQPAVDRDALVHAVYTGVVPIVYKAQRTLLTSLVDSIGWAFLMIALVMMIVLRRGPLRWCNLLNIRAGLISMAPNVFPIMLIFGFMGHAHVLIDIGTMMTASVAMGVAVDDTIHFLTWFRDGYASGLSRSQAVLYAYQRCAAAMTQTTLIGGLGLAVFAFSTFTPTQYFGVMMLALLVAALVGDLIFLPALLAGPLGRYFCPQRSEGGTAEWSCPPCEQSVSDSGSPHFGQTRSAFSLRRHDAPHRRWTAS